MLAIARALMTNPDLLLMDEPTEGLAPLLVREVGRVLEDLKAEGLSILLVEQNMPDGAPGVRPRARGLARTDRPLLHAGRALREPGRHLALSWSLIAPRPQTVWTTEARALYPSRNPRPARGL